MEEEGSRKGRRGATLELARAIRNPPRARSSRARAGSTKRFENSETPKPAPSSDLDDLRCRTCALYALSKVLGNIRKSQKDFTLKFSVLKYHNGYLRNSKPFRYFVSFRLSLVTLIIINHGRTSGSVWLRLAMLIVADGNEFAMNASIFAGSDAYC